MCGIAGILFHHSLSRNDELNQSHREDYAHREDQTHREAMAAAMLRAILHRGPDDGGLLVDDPMYLGHRRLSILDTSDAGHQPMSDRSGRFWLSYNGELYNHASLRSQLQSHGIPFRTRTDTEVLLQGILYWGKEVLTRLDGMFAFAFWDSRERALWLVRDGQGIKPLFYSLSEEQFAFASEIKGLLAMGLPRSIDRRSICEFLTYGYSAAPATGFRNISQLLPGHALELTAGSRQPSIRRWYQLPYPSSPATWSRTESSERLRESLHASVTSQMQSDVPLGAFLSGGLDSSAIAACMASNTAYPIKTFTIAFEEASYDESAAASAVAESLRTEHHSPRTSENHLECLQSIVHFAEDPLADNSMVAMWNLCQTTAKQVKVALSGDGADELLAGYSTYRATALAATYRSLPKTLREDWIAPCVRALPPSDRKYALSMFAKRFVDGADLQPPFDHCSWRTMLPESLARQLIVWDEAPSREEVLQSYSQSLDEAPPWLSPLERCLHLDLTFHLPNDMLVKVDRMSMAHSLEVRVPFLGNQVIETCLSLPARWKFSGRREKQILRDAMHGLLPQSILKRKKAGFVIPIEAWLRGPWREGMNHYLSQDFCVGTQLLDWPTLERMMKVHISRREDHAYSLFTLLVLAMWWRHWISNPNVPEPSIRPTKAVRHRVTRRTVGGWTSESVDGGLQ
jgi:asparagine synthase (glutamine-hydrolysing)